MTRQPESPLAELYAFRDAFFLLLLMNVVGILVALGQPPEDFRIIKYTTMTVSLVVFVGRILEESIMSDDLRQPSPLKNVPSVTTDSAREQMSEDTQPVELKCSNFDCHCWTCAERIAELEKQNATQKHTISELRALNVAGKTIGDWYELEAQLNHYKASYAELCEESYAHESRAKELEQQLEQQRNGYEQDRLA